jgi:hypothetical protein
MDTNNKIKDDAQSLQSCVSVSVTELRIGNLILSFSEKHFDKYYTVSEIREVSEEKGYIIY